MLSFFAHVAPEGAKHHIEARGHHNSATFTLTATATRGGGSVKLKTTIRYDNGLSDTLWDGVLGSDRCITGSQGSARFLWKQVHAELMVLRPLPPYRVPGRTVDSWVPSKARALFDYAIRAVIRQNRRRAWSWSHFRQRRDDCNYYLDTRTVLAMNGSNMARVDAPRTHKTLHSITPTDGDFYNSVWQRTFKLIPRQS